LLLGGQIRDEAHNLCLLYPQGNPLFATEDSPFLQIGECKYGRPILDRCVRYNATSLAEAAKYALLSIDSTMRSNVTVGPPIDLTVYVRNELRISQHRRFDAKDPDLRDIQTRWESSLRKAVLELPEIRFGDLDAKPKSPRDERDSIADGGLTERML
jgi:putative proteasome-type protease